MAPGEGELTAALRLLTRLLPKLKKSIDLVLGDALYCCRPYLKLAYDHGVGALAISSGVTEMDERALSHNLLPRAHVLSTRARQLRDVLHARDQLVRLRGRLITMLRGQFQGRGLTAPRCDTPVFATRLRASGLPGVDAIDVQALLVVLDSVNAQLGILTEHLVAMGKQEEAFERLCSVPGVKLIVALAFIAALVDASRFDVAHEVQAYLGLVPSEYTTGGKRRTGRITRCGNTMARHLLVQAARALLRTRSAQEDPLVVWAKEVASRRGTKRAVVALARRLAGVLWAIWVDGTFYDPAGLARRS